MLAIIRACTIPHVEWAADGHEFDKQRTLKGAASVRSIATIVALAALIAFAVMYGRSICQTWYAAAETADAAIASNTSGNATTGEPDDPYVWVATGLAGQQPMQFSWSCGATNVIIGFE